MDKDIKEIITFEKFQKMLFYNDLNTIHKDLFFKIINLKEKITTFQMHRNAYKTSLIILSVVFLFSLTEKTILIVKKNDYMAKLLLKEILRKINNKSFKLFLNIIGCETFSFNANSITKINNLNKEPNILAVGLKTSITGLHFDYIFCDDISTDIDRYSAKEREYTNNKFMEIKNLIKKDGKIILCGTPWHKEDVFSLVDNIYKYNVYETGIFSQEKILELKKTMPSSLFACNYELKHINEYENYFHNIKIKKINFEGKKCFMHIDTAFTGEDYTAISICFIEDNIFYVKGFCRRVNSFELIDYFIKLIFDFNVLKVFIETNADQGAIAREIKKKNFINIIAYRETRKKHLKIIENIKKNQDNIIIDIQSDKEYIEQIINYSDFSKNDDAPDSLSTIIGFLSTNNKKILVE